MASQGINIGSGGGISQRLRGACPYLFVHAFALIGLNLNAFSEIALFEHKHAVPAKNSWYYKAGPLPALCVSSSVYLGIRNFSVINKTSAVTECCVIFTWQINSTPLGNWRLGYKAFDRTKSVTPAIKSDLVLRRHNRLIFYSHEFRNLYRFSVRKLKALL